MLRANAGDAVPLPTVSLKWVSAGEDTTHGSSVYQLPVYLNSDRADILFIVDLPAETPPRELAQRGAAIVLG
jgi:dynein heavy chain 1, cytosolic